MLLEFERERYKLICDRFRKRGGNSIVDFNPRNIEYKLIEMGLEEDLFVSEDSKLRRRKRLVERRRGSCAVKGEPSVTAAAASMMMGGSEEGHGVSPLNTLTEEQEDDVLDQIDTRGYADLDMDDSPADSPRSDAAAAAAAASSTGAEELQHLQQQQQQAYADAGPGPVVDPSMTTSATGPSPSSGSVQQQADRVSRQTCEDLMGSASPFGDHHHFFAHHDLAVLS